jgi:hypothetical protein
MNVIWGKREGKYFWEKDWTGRNRLIWLWKLVFRRKGYETGCEPKPSLRAKRSNPSRHEMERWIASSLGSSQ